MTQRSNNRFREHNDHWWVEDARKSLPCFDGGPGVYMQCGEPCNWYGWIPLADAKELGIVPTCFEPKG